ncbi:MAG: hypothetical protein RQ756_01815 [Flavobacteriaceae bacterium]|nr:hypothetical protein [Flavobacteriaceae bacterium]
MRKQFIKIAQKYQPKNKLADAIIKELSHFNQVLVNDGKTATRLIDSAFMQVCKNYLERGGAAQLPDYKTYTDDNMTSIHVPNVIILYIYEVKEELNP